MPIIITGYKKKSEWLLQFLPKLDYNLEELLSEQEDTIPPENCEEERTDAG